VSEPIDIPGAEDGQYITVNVRTPNGTTLAVQVYDAPSHPANIGKLKAAVDPFYVQLFGAEVDPYTNPLQVYTTDWADIDDDYQVIADGDWYGVCWTNADGGAALVGGGDEGLFPLDP
jgi:hypothetical protein